MLKSMIFLTLAGLLVGSLAKPMEKVGPQPVTKPKFNSTETGLNSFKNPVYDIKLTPQQIQSGISDERYRWREGFVVHPDRAFDEREMNIINDALYTLSQVLCIPVLLWPQDSNPTGDYVEMMRGGGGSGCWAYVGRLGGRQDLNLQFDGCIYKDIVMHESIHALGYFHEQSRPDRDNFVNILWENIIPEYQYAFDRFDDTQMFGVPYDLRSIMHYNTRDFTSNGAETIVSKDGSPVGPMGELTGNDVDKLRRMYNC